MASRVRRRAVPDIWPGFVDAISTLLIIIIFLLMLFTLAQYFLSEILSGRNEALDRLNREVAELADMLSLERESNTRLRGDLGLLSGELQSSTAARDQLSAQLVGLNEERDQLAALLAARTTERDRMGEQLAAASARADKADADLVDAFKTIEADREKITTQLANLEILRRDIAALRKVRAELETRVGSLAATLDENRVQLTAERDRAKALEARLSSEQERTALAQKEIDQATVRLAELRRSGQQSTAALESEKQLSTKARARVNLLNRQIAAMRQQLARLLTALEASEAKSRDQNVQIVNLGSRLNAALASKVEELARYRSEFFGRLREALGDIKGVRIEGDRFVFQSEVLFPSGSADLAPQGQTQIAQLAETLKQVSARIPAEIDWVLRVDGHTDRLPIRTAQFPSNWELSAARAISVVKFLISLGLQPHRLAATGFAQHRPIDTGNSPQALSRNRRIEFKLTGR
ncbi:MAG: peptidoglycan -binding protein [Alphaproteobacteria bacterium]